MMTQSCPQTSEDLASENKNKMTIEYGNETPYELKKTKISSENTVSLKYGTNQSPKIYLGITKRTGRLHLNLRKLFEIRC